MIYSFILLALFIYFINFFFIKFWNKLSKTTPTGAGIILIIPFSYYIFNNGIHFISGSLLILLTLLYFLDDIIKLHFLIRILIQITAGIIIIMSSNIDLNIFLICFYILAFFSIVNILNFQDGQDLNIFSLLTFIFSIFYFYTNHILINITSLIVLLCLVIFSYFNKKKLNLYFGDSGCFIASILIFIFIYKDIENYNLLKVIIASLSFPIVDVFAVIVYRLYKNENLLTRNYYHTYQILFYKTKFKSYLIPNLLFGLINIYVSSYFVFNLNFIFILLFLNIFFCILLQFVLTKIPNYNEN